MVILSTWIGRKNLKTLIFPKIDLNRKSTTKKVRDRSTDRDKRSNVFVYRSNISVVTSVVLYKDNLFASIDHETARMNDITDSFKTTIDDYIIL